jgi:RimJ/RimL family protein N-acetyltransferase
VSFRLRTERLIIRPFDYADAEAWVAMLSDPEVHRFLPPGPAPTMETFERAIESRRAMQREIGYAMWAVEDRTTGAFIGQCGIRPAKSMDEKAGSEIDLAYHFARASWNKG